MSPYPDYRGLPDSHSGPSRPTAGSRRRKSDRPESGPLRGQSGFQNELIAVYARILAAANRETVISSWIMSPEFCFEIASLSKPYDRSEMPIFSSLSDFSIWIVWKTNGFRPCCSRGAMPSSLLTLTMPAKRLSVSSFGFWRVPLRTW
jgi:hypothetical protein